MTLEKNVMFFGIFANFGYITADQGKKKIVTAEASDNLALDGIW